MFISTDETDWRRERVRKILGRESRLRLFEQLHQNDDFKWRRASGKTFCSLCGLPYQNHPYDEEHPLYSDGYDNRLCDGTVVHL